MLERFYYYLRRKTSLPEEKEAYSAGYWEGSIRLLVREMCRQSQGRLLEVGCGEGLFLSRLAREAPDCALSGVDNNLERLRLACTRRDAQNSQGRSAFVLADGAQLPFREHSFDTVVCINVFLNLPGLGSVEHLLAEMVRVCRPAGRIIFDFRNSRNMFVRLKFKSAPLYDRTVRNLPLRAYAPERIRACLTTLKLRNVREKHLGFALFGSAPIIIIEASP